MLPWTAGCTNFEWVGNSYNFNANGYPKASVPVGGLAVKVTHVRRSQAPPVEFFDGGLCYDFAWHGHEKGNFCMVDGHVEFIKMPTDNLDEQYNWLQPLAAAAQ